MITPRTENKEFSEILEVLLEDGLDGMPRVFEMLMNMAMKIERNRALRAEPYERTDERKGYANGFKPKHLKSRVGMLNLQIPKVRDGVSFYPASLERGLRSDRALLLGIAEMYLNGVSTRKVTNILEELCGLEITSSEVSRATAMLDKELDAWRNRSLGESPRLILDATFHKVRRDGVVRSAVILSAIGIDPTGHRSVLGVCVTMKESEIYWREFLNSLKNRGLHGVKYVVSDAHEGLISAIGKCFKSAVWNRCHVHLQRNAGNYVPKVEMRAQVAEDIRWLFASQDANAAQDNLEHLVRKYTKKAPQLARWMESELPDGFGAYRIAKSERRHLRTTNTIERYHREIKRRVRVTGPLPNEASLLRLVTAILIEISDEWETGRKYMTVKELIRL